MGLGRKIMEIKCHFNYIVAKVLIVKMTSFLMINEIIGFYTIKLLFLPLFPYCIFWKKSPHAFHPLRAVLI